MAWVFLRDPSAGLYGKPRMVVFNIVVFLSGLVIYYVAKEFAVDRASTSTSASRRSPRSERLAAIVSGA